jgi:hypothetical protein
MAVYYNLKGTTQPQFQIGKGGVTLYQGNTEPVGENGDFWLDTNGEVKVKVSGSWQLITFDNLSFSGNTITSTDANGDINIIPDGTGDVVLGTAGGGTSTMTAPGDADAIIAGGDGSTGDNPGGDLYLRGGTGSGVGADGDVILDIGNLSLTSGDIILTEKADHSSTPTGGFGYIWLKNDTPSSLMFTDDEGTDYDLTVPIVDWTSTTETLDTTGNVNANNFIVSGVISRDVDNTVQKIWGGAANKAAGLALYGSLTPGFEYDIKFENEFATELYFDYSSNSWDFQGNEIVFSEKADHDSTPTTGKGYIWLKNDTPSSLMFTDDAGNDYDLTDITSDAFATISVTDTDSGFTWSETGDAVASGADTVSLVSGTDIDLDVDTSNGAVRVAFANNTGYTTNTGTVTSITAGDGLNFTEINTTGSVTLGTPSSLTATTTNAVDTNSHTHAIDSTIARIASPTFTGTPAAPTAAVNTNTTQIATTAYVIAQIADDAPAKDGTGATGTWGISITGSANTATTATNANNINISANTSTDTTTYPVLVGANTTGNQSPLIDNVDLSYNASTGALTASSFVGDLTGSADTADQWTTTRTIDMSGDVSSDSVNIDGSGNITITNTALGTNSVVTGNITDDNVTYSKIQNVVSNNVFLGNVSGAGSVVDEITGTEATAILDTFTDTLKGLAPASGGGTANFLRADGTWTTPAGGISNAYATMTVTDTDSGYTWAETGSAAASGDDTVTLVSGTDIDIDVDATNDAIRVAFSNDTGYTTNTGTVTSVAISGTDGIEVDSGSPVTAAGTITLGLNATTIEGNLNHDNLNGFVSEEHIDWTSASDNLSTSGTVTAVEFISSLYNAADDVSVTIEAGDGSGSNNGADLVVRGGAAGTSANDGKVIIGHLGTVLTTMSAPDDTSLLIQAGSGTGNNDGGDLTLRPGVLAGTGADGDVIIDVGNFSLTSGDIVLTERADHNSTPTAGFGYLWVRSDTPSSLIYTADDGTDYDLTSAGTGTVTEVTVGTGLDVTNGTTTPNITLSLDELTIATTELTSSDYVICLDGTAERKITLSNLANELETIGSWGSGTVTEVTVGTGLDVTSGTTTPNITLSLDELTIATTELTSSDYVICLDGTAERKITLTNLANELEAIGGWGSGGSGTVTSVSAGTGMDFTTITTSGSVSIDTSQTAITSMYNTALRVGYDTSNYTDYNLTTTDFYFDGVIDFRFSDGGAMLANSNITAYSGSISSDRKLKDNIRPIENALEKVRTLTGCEYTLKAHGKNPASEKAGLIAQNVQEVLPCAVEMREALGDEEEHLTLDYNAVIGLLVQAVNELADIVQEKL